MKLTISIPRNYRLLLLLFVTLAGCATGSRQDQDLPSVEIIEAPDHMAETLPAAATVPPRSGDNGPVANQGASPNDSAADQRTLILAARYGHVDTVRTLLDKEIDINARDELGSTALIAAAGEPYDQVVRLLIKNGAEPDMAMPDGTTALMRAAGKGRLSNVELLLRSGADIEARDGQGDTALVYAIRFAYPEIVEFLADKGADVALYDQNQVIRDHRKTPLMIASEYGGASPHGLRIVRSLLDHGADANIKQANGDTALTIAERRGYRLIAAELRQRGAIDESAYSALTREEALLKAIKRGDNRKIEELVGSGVDPNYRNDETGITPLVSAAYYGNHQAAKSLIEKGARVNDVPWGLRESRINSSSIPLQDRDIARTVARGDSPLMVAIRRGQSAVAEILLEHGAISDLPNRNSETPGLIAARTGNTGVMTAMLRKGMDPDLTEMTHLEDYFLESIVKREKVRALLIEAAFNGHMDTVTVLLDAGANPNVEDDNGRTSLFWAAARGYADIVEVLLRFGADSNIKDETGSDALIQASKSGYSRIVKLLLDAGADYNSVDGLSGYTADTVDQGLTPLIYAARGGHVDTVRLLLDKGADRSRLSNTGETALDVAAKNGHDAVVELLRMRR